MRKRVALILGCLSVIFISIILVNYYSTFSKIELTKLISVEKYEWISDESLLKKLDFDHHFENVDIYYRETILFDDDEVLLNESLFEYDSKKGIRLKNDIELNVVYRSTFYKKETIVQMKVRDSIFPEIIVKSDDNYLKDGDIVKISENDQLGQTLLINSYDKYGDEEIPIDFLSNINMQESLKPGNYELILSATDDAGNSTTFNLGVISESKKSYAQRPPKKEKTDSPNTQDTSQIENSEDESRVVNVVGKNLHSVEILVNKNNGLPSDFVPSLVTIPSGYAVSEGYRATSDTTNAFISMVDSMYGETGLLVYVTSSYRSYSFQKELYESYVISNGQEAADRFSAKPGLSEHQTGLAIDMVAPGISMWNFAETDQSKWVSENAHRFGFILRYLPGKESITV